MNQRAIDTPERSEAWRRRLDRYDGLIFDCDGTLTNSMPLHYIAWRDTMSEHGISFEEDLFYRWGGKPTDEIIRTLADRDGVSLDVDAVGRAKEAAFVHQIDRLRPRTDVVAAARAMHGRAALSVASGGVKSVVRQQIEHVGLMDLFPVIVTAEDTPAHKPSPEPFLAAAAAMGVEPAGCLVWEDSPLGFEAARAAGMAWVDVRGETKDWIWSDGIESGWEG